MALMMSRKVDGCKPLVRGNILFKHLDNRLLNEVVDAVFPVTFPAVRTPLMPPNHLNVSPMKPTTHQPSRNKFAQVL
jgi:hypothetical protein